METLGLEPLGVGVRTRVFFRFRRFCSRLLCALLSSSAGFSSEMRTSASASSEYAEAVSFIDADFFIICGRTFTPTSVTIAKQAARLPYLTRSLFALLCFVLFLVESAAFSTFPSFSARICAMTEFFMLVCGPLLLLSVGILQEIFVWNSVYFVACKSGKLNHRGISSP